MDSKCILTAEDSTLLKKKRPVTKKAMNFMYFVMAAVIISTTLYLVVKFFQIVAYISIINKPMTFTQRSPEINISGKLVMNFIT